MNPTPFLDAKRAEELVVRTIDLARARGDRPLLAKLLWNKAQASFWQGAPDMGEPAALESAEIARAIGERDQLGYTLNTLGQIYREKPDLEGAERVLRESIELFRETGNRPMEADSLSTMGFIHLYRSEWSAAVATGEEAFRISDALDNDWGRSYALFTPSFVQTELGDWGRALDSYERCVAFARRAGFTAAQTAVGSDLGLLYALAGDVDRGVAHLDGVVQMASAGMPQWLPWAQAQLARVLVIKGDLDRADEVLAQAVPRVHGRGNLYMAVDIALARAELALARGHYAEAAEIATTDRRLATQRALTPFEKDFDLVAGAALLRAGDLPGARAALEVALTAVRASGSRRLLHAILGTLAAVARAEGGTEEAARLQREAAAEVDLIAASLRARGLEERFRARLAAAGVSAPAATL
ncbi:MAG: tetratricopeptide repeat protein [Candidatus Limnocylindria bacterium]